MFKQIDSDRRKFFGVPCKIVESESVFTFYAEDDQIYSDFPLKWWYVQSGKYTFTINPE